MFHDFLHKICEVPADMATKLIYRLQDIENSDFGLLGDVHISIKDPGQNPERYFNREKKPFSLILQAVCTKRFDHYRRLVYFQDQFMMCKI